MRAVKIALAAVAGVVLLLVVAVAVVAWTFDPNEYKGVATEAFTARTGRSLTIDEDLRLTYFPWLAVETGGVTIGSATEFGGAAQPFATARRVAARVKLLPLLSRRIEVGTVELEGLTLNLARDAALRGNWEDLLAATAQTAPAAADAQPGAATVDELAIEAVRIREGNVYWRENTNELRYSVTGWSLTTGGIGSGEPIELETALRFTDETSGLKAELAASAVVAAAADGSVSAADLETTVKIDAGDGSPVRELAADADRIEFDRAAETLNVAGLVTQIAGTRAEWQVSGSALLTNAALSGSVALEAPELTAVAEQARISLPASLSTGELGPLTLAGQFAFQQEPQTVQLTGIDANALGMHLTGQASLVGYNVLEGRVVVDPFTPNAALQALLRDAAPTVDAAAVGTLALETGFATVLDGNRMALRDLRLTALGTTVTGTLETVLNARGNLYQGRVQTTRFDSESLVKAFAAQLPPGLTSDELGMLELAASFALDSAADTLTVQPLRAEAFGLRMSGNVAASNVSTAATWTGSGAIAQFSPQELLQRFGLPPQQTSDPRAFTRASVDTRFTITKDGAQLDALKLALDETTIEGDFSLHGFETPAYRFTLNVDAVDADRYLPPKARDAEAGEATAGDIELPQNNTMNLDGTMNVASLKLAGMQFNDVGGRIVIGGGDLTVENARTNLYGGTFVGNFRVHAAGDDPGLALDGRASGIQLEPLIAALTGGEPNFSGTGSFDLNLAGKGRTVIQNVETAGGNVSFDMANGAIKGFNLGRTLCAAYNVTQRAPAPPEQPAVTAYEGIKGSAVVSNGTATSNDLLARTSFMDINGNGTLGLVEQRLDYELDAKLTGSIGIPNCETLDSFIGGEVPFTISGTVTEPVIRPDFSKLVRQQLRDAVQDRIQDRLRDLLR
jgi:AsmA protein